MMKKQKLELTWIGKENRPKLEPRILLEDPAKSYHAKHRVTENDIFDNQLIFPSYPSQNAAKACQMRSRVFLARSLSTTESPGPEPVS